MIVRNLARCSLIWHIPAKTLRPRLMQAKQRKFSTSISSIATNTSPSPSAILGVFTNDLDKIAPRFEVDGSQIRILRSPAEFYEALKAKILSAERHIFLSTLYIGKTEHALISVLRQALRAKPDLKLSILTDALRGTREAPEPSCASLLAPLVTEFGSERVDIRMYHTPNLTGAKKHLPKRINEGFGLQHMKLYGVDDELIMSGANLSTDYFTNRQDRYHVFSSRDVTDHFFKIHKAVSGLSFLVTPDTRSPAGFTLEWPTSNLAPSPLTDPAKYISSSSSILSELIMAPQSSSSPGSKTNTTVYPLFQLTSLLSPNTSTELPFITSILSTLSSPAFSTSSWTFTAGYFNPDPSLAKLLLSTTSTSNTVITASPRANGFYGSAGVSGLLPAAYTLLARRFLQAAAASRHHASATILKEWQRGTVGVADGWTYHAKGLWVSLNGENHPSITVVGSSNYTKRSYRLDLEAGVAIVTSDEGLKRKLAEERDGLQDYARQVSMDEFVKTERRVGIQVRVAMWIVSLLGGAL